MPAAQAKTAIDGEVGVQRDGARTIVHVRRHSPFPHAYFDPGHWRSQAEAIGTGRGSAWIVRAAAGVWVLRHYRRGGAVARLSEDRYVFTGYERSRSVREFRLLRTLRQRGLPVPEPIAARVVRAGLTYSADLITTYLADTRSLGERLADGVLDASTLAAAGRCIRRFHDAGVCHADLNAHNILLDETGAAYLIDFDRARLRRPGPWQAANLRRLRRSCDKLARQHGAPEFDADAWERLVAAYAQ